MKIWANTIVNNEENFIWFAVMSVINYVNKVVIYDTGSTDNTVEIIKDIKKEFPNKVIFKEVGEVSDIEFPKIRQQMLEESECDWILVLDGDEIWWENSIKKVIQEINTKEDEIEGIVVPFFVPVGDIYHLQEERAGKYNLLGRKGHLSLRAFSKNIPGLHVDCPYGKESFLDVNNTLIQERKNNVFVNAPYLHTTHLKRSSQKRKNDKFKYELGKRVSSDFKFPEVLYEVVPTIVSFPFIQISGSQLLKAAILTPLRKFKRRLND